MIVEQTGTVARHAVGERRAAVRQAAEDRRALLDDLVVRAVLHVGDEADTAGVVLGFREVERRYAAVAELSH